MNTLIKTIEDLSLNAWPSHQIELYDGWILRFSYFYTHRTNSVEQIGPSTIPVEEKVQKQRNRTNLKFRIWKKKERSRCPFIPSICRTL